MRLLDYYQRPQLIKIFYGFLCYAALSNRRVGQKARNGGFVCIVVSKQPIRYKYFILFDCCLGVREGVLTHKKLNYFWISLPLTLLPCQKSLLLYFYTFGLFCLYGAFMKEFSEINNNIRILKALITIKSYNIVIY